MDKNLKLSEELLKIDNIDPSNIPESERAMLKKMLDEEMKHNKKLSWGITGFMWIFAIAMIGLCMSERLLERLHIPFVAAALLLMAGVFIVIFILLPKQYKQIKESNEKVHKLHFLAHGKYKGFPLVGKKNGIRYIDWLNIILLAATIWFVMSIGSAGVYFLLCRRWIFSSESGAVFHIFFLSIMSFTFVAGMIYRGLKAPLEELTEIIPENYTCSRRKFYFAAIAIIIAFVFIGRYFPSSFSSVALADVVAAINKANWVHIKYEINEFPDDVEIIRTPEFWESVNPHKVIHIYGDGAISIDEESDFGKYTLYDIKTNKITIKYSNVKSSDAQLSSFQNLFRNQLYDLEERGGKVTYSDSVFQGKKVKLIDVDNTNISETGFIMTMYVNPQTLLPIKVNLEKVDGRDIKASGIIDFPEQGPTDIYELGVPRDAEVEIIDNRS